MPETPVWQAGGRPDPALDPSTSPIGITEMEYRVLELLAFARNKFVTDHAIEASLRRSDDQPQPKIIDVFISKLRKKLRNASGGAEFIETIPQRGWILRDIDATSGA
jgi:DNA-binding response OmpR family regulator